MSIKNDVVPSASHSFEDDVQRHFFYTLGRFDHHQHCKYYATATSLAVRDRLMEKWKRSVERVRNENTKQVFYLSLEFLLGRSLNNAVINMDLQQDVARTLQQVSCRREEIEDEERDAGLGNGGLGRLAACFMDSCATLNLPVTGYGIRYEYGMFHQLIEQGYQVEQPDHWLVDGNPWEIERPAHVRRINFYGCTEYYCSDSGQQLARWVDTHDVLAVPYDMPIPGYKNDTVNTLRLWKAVATHEFDLNDFNEGDYAEAVAQKNLAEQITMVLYPNDASENGKELRLRQQYFLASASLQDVLCEWVSVHGEDFSDFADYHCFQLNDTHPTLAIPELMRLLLDDYRLGWDKAWAIVSRTMAYTNHTLLPEALERWSLRLVGDLLPRLLDIIYEINARFLAEVAHVWPGDTERQQRMSIVEEGSEPQVRMAYLGIVGSFSVNGVAALHSALLTSGLFKDFYELWSYKFNSKTNGVTPRRWISHSNQSLTQLLNETIGDGWVRDFNQITQLKPYVNDTAFCNSWYQVKQQNKQRLASLVEAQCGITFDTQFLFDVQVKRIHEYKRQLLNLLHVIHLYDKISRGDGDSVIPRNVIIGGKAAPGYTQAKLIIKLINNVAQVVNSDVQASKKIKLIFLPNYCVSSMEIICPGTDVSEQISTAGKEASGTGNMKFMMNGAVTIGTYDGANIEILDAVGEDNFFLFGLRVEEIANFSRQFKPNMMIEQDQDLRRVLNLIECGHFSMFEQGIFQPIVDAIRHPEDPWMVAADFRSYITAQNQLALAYQDRQQWTKMSILNTASSAHFSSDRTINEYASDIWNVSPTC